MLQISKMIPSRFASIANSPYEQSVPLSNGDTFNFKVTVSGATGQYALTDRPSEFDSRVYGIKLILSSNADAAGADTLNVVPVEGAPSPANEYPYA